MLTKLQVEPGEKQLSGYGQKALTSNSDTLGDWEKGTVWRKKGYNETSGSESKKKEEARRAEKKKTRTKRNTRGFWVPRGKGLSKKTKTPA